VLAVVISMFTINNTYANWWDWFIKKSTEHVADQYVYEDTCQEAYEEVTYIFGIEVNREMKFRVFQCGS
jgi:hypothetical protein